MKYEVEKLQGEVKITFTLTAEEWDAQINKAYLKEKSKINIPGFRKGQAPRKMIERMYGPSVFFDEAFNGAFYDAYTKVASLDTLAISPSITISELFLR